MARNVRLDFRRGGGSSLEVLYGKVSLTPTMLHSVANSVVLPAPSTFDLVNGVAVATNVAPSPEPIDGQVEWAYRVRVQDRHSKTFEYLVGVPEGTTEINFNVLPRYFETKPPLFGRGPQGIPGEAATIAIGTTTSGPTPAVTNSGTSTEAVLNFTLAKGDKGDTGAGVPAGGTALQVVRKNAANTTTEWATVDKALVGLGNVDNTSDANKPVSTAQKAYVDALELRTDANVAALVELPTSDTSVALDKAYLKRGEFVFNVMDYGAEGDGVANDQPAFESALVALNAVGGGTLYLPRNTYNIPGVVQLKSNTIVQGVPGATIVNGVGTTTSVTFSILSEGQKGYGSGAKNVFIRDLRFQGSFTTGRAVGVLAAHHGQNIYIERCVVSEGHFYGHIVDLQGCDNVVFRDCVFEGANYSGATARLTSEAIQLDYSTRTGASAIDLPGSYDGLPTINVVIDSCKFLPITVGGVSYPCPNPVGSHFTVQDRFVQNIRFTNNVVEHPVEDVVNGLRGTLHFVAAKDILIQGNIFKGLGTRSQRVIATYGLTTAFAVSGVENSGQTSITLPTPVTCSNLVIDSNTFEGFATAETTNDLMYLSGQNTSAFLEDLTVTNNKFKGCYPPATDTNVGQHLLYPRFARRINISRNTVDRSRRLVYFGTVRQLNISYNYSGFSGGGGDVNGSGSEDIKVIGNTFLGTSLAFYATTSTSVMVLNNTITTRTDVTSVIDVNNVSRYTISGNDISCSGTTARGVVTRGASKQGIIKNNIISGATLTVLVEDTSEAVNVDNIS